VSDEGPIIGVIPARYASTRFPGKPLALIAGKPMIRLVHERVSKARLLSRVVVATDDDRIRQAVEAFGGEAMMTSRDHKSGTDRVAEVARHLEAPYFINVQGDEPLIDPGHIDACAAMLLEGEAMATLAVRVTSRSELFDQNLARVVVSESGHAIYFSRCAVPFPRKYLDRGVDVDLEASRYLRHVGIYGYSRAALFEITGAAPCEAEELESLEQLRPLFLGIKIGVRVVAGSAPCVDVPEDIAKVEGLLRSAGVE
jgi:3-deoxy-manno-octulosonate cytidylyltransferase (CMP-KDO synthetase)